GSVPRPNRATSRRRLPSLRACPAARGGTIPERHHHGQPTVRSDAFHPARIEAIETAHLWVRIRELAWQRAEVASAVEELGATMHLACYNWVSANAGIARQQLGDRRGALISFERAGAIDDQAAWLGQLDRARQQPALQGSQRRDVGFALEPG